MLNNLRYFFGSEFVCVPEFVFVSELVPRTISSVVRRTNLTNYEQRMYFWDPDGIQIVHKGYSNYHSCVYIENETSQALCRLLFR